MRYIRLLPRLKIVDILSKYALASQSLPMITYEYASAISNRWREIPSITGRPPVDFYISKLGLDYMVLMDPEIRDGKLFFNSYHDLINTVIIFAIADYARSLLLNFRQPPQPCII